MTFGTEFWSAISGAIVGGLIAFCIQMTSLYAAKKERLAEKRERSETLAYGVLFKAMRINSNLYNLHLNMEKSYSAVDPRLHDDPCSFVLPIAGTPADVHLSTDEMSFVLSLKDPSLTDNLMSLDVIHNNLIDIFETYSGLRSEMLATMPAKMEGNMGKSTFSEEEWMMVRPKMVAMNQLLGEARTRAKTDYEDSNKAVDGLLKAINEKLQLTLKIDLKAEKLAALEKATTQFKAQEN